MYGLTDLPVEHLPKQTALQAMLRAARRKVKKGRQPWLKGSLVKDFNPTWRTMDKTVREPQKGQDFASFAHFSSCWWARALALLAHQADVAKEAVVYERLLRQYLNLCKLAQEKGVQIAYEYDRVQWATIADRIDAKDRSVAVNDEFGKLNTDMRRDAEDLCERATAKDAPGPSKA